MTKRLSLKTVIILLLSLLILQKQAGARVHVTVSLPDLTQKADVICIGTVVRPNKDGQILPDVIEGPDTIKIKIQSILKGTVTKKLINVYIWGDMEVTPQLKTAMFFLNGSDKLGNWELVPAFYQPIISLGDVKGETKPDTMSNLPTNDKSTPPLYLVLSKLCEALPNVDTNDQDDIMVRLLNIVPLLDSHITAPSVAPHLAQIGGSSTLHAFTKRTILPAIEPFYNNPDGDIRRLALRLGVGMQDKKASDLVQQNKK